MVLTVFDKYFFFCLIIIIMQHFEDTLTFLTSK